MKNKKSEFSVTLWGTRGSMPTPLLPADLEARIKKRMQEYIDSKMDFDVYWDSLPRPYKGGYGGNTLCVEVQTHDQHIIIDAGTGLRHTVAPLMGDAQAAAGKADIHLFFTHFHWDHLMGLPFFAPLYIKGNNVHLYAVQEELEETVRMLFRKPHFPVPFEQLLSNIHFHQLQPREAFKLGKTKLTPYLLDHPDPCWGYKIESGGKCYSHCVDTEATRLSRAELGADLPLYQGVDLMLFDGQYSIEEAQEKKNWGHSSAPRGLELAMREEVKKIIFVHHDPWAFDQHIAHTGKKAALYYEEHLKADDRPIEWGIGFEGMKLLL